MVGWAPLEMHRIILELYSQGGFPDELGHIVMVRLSLDRMLYYRMRDVHVFCSEAAGD